MGFFVGSVDMRSFHHTFAGHYVNHYLPSARATSPPKNKPREWVFNTIQILALQSGASPSGALHPAIAGGDLWPPQTHTGDLRFYGMQL